jgi:hypothetical protein
MADTDSYDPAQSNPWLTWWFQNVMGLGKKFPTQTAEGAIKAPNSTSAPSETGSIQWGSGQQMPFRRPQAPSAPEPQENPRLGPDANMAPRTGMEKTPFKMPTRPGQQFSGPTPLPPRRDEAEAAGSHKVWYDKNMRRVGIGDKAPEGIDPEAYEMEPNKMSALQRFMRGAYDVNEAGEPAFLAGAFQKKAEGGSIGHASRIAQEKSTPCHKGIIHMAVGGRTDHLPMNVLEGSYVLPADIVSGLGEGNTLAGGKILDQMFSGKQGPAGARMTDFRASPKFPEAQKITPEDFDKYIKMGRTAGQALYGKQAAEQSTPAARGGTIASHNRRPVPIIAAGGEYVIDPDDVINYGGGDLDRGHEKLDQFVKFVRANTVKTLRKLPGPRKD